jgi:signal transduction histidine kinase/ligand-binding sensor domain-containing protein
MTSTSKKNHIHYLIIFLFILITSCNNFKEAPPFPNNENEYAQPKTKSFEFSKPDTLQWISSKLKNLPIKKFSWDKLTSKPIDIGLPYALKAPLTKKPFDWNSLPSTPFSLDSLPKEDLEIKVTELGDPKIVKANNPVTPPQSSRGVMNIDANFGLPGAVFCSTKDKNGMLWFGTSNAIARYDSEKIIIYGEDQGLNASNIFSLLFDSKGRLWLTDNNNSISVIDFEANIIYKLTSNNKLDVYGMMEDKKGRIWYANRDFGYNIINLKEKWSRQINTKNGLLGNFNITPFQDNEGLIWLSTNRGVNILDLKAGKNISITKENGLLDNFISSLYEDQNGKMWITGGGGINILNKNKTELSYFTALQGLDGLPAASEVFQDKTDKFWIGSVNGLLFSYDEPTETIERYVLNDSNSQFVFDFLEDNQGQIWASVAQGGLFKVNKNDGKPGNFTKENGLTDNTVWSTLEAKDGNIWIGTEGGIDVYDPETRSLKHLGIEQGLVNDRNTRLMEDSKGRIWTCGSISGVNVIDPVNETIQQITKNEGIVENRIRSIFEDNNGLFWLGGNAGELITLDLKKSIINNLVLDTAQVQVTNNIIIEDDKNHIWIGTLDSGIQKIDPSNNMRQRITTANGLVHDRVYSLYADDKNAIWAVTQKGVQIIDFDNKKLTTFTTTEGLGANDVYDVTHQKGETFLGTSNGLTILKHLDNGTEQGFWKVKTVGKNQGLNLVDFSENSFTFDKNDRLWAGVQGLMLTVMDEIKEDTTVYPTAITGINIMDKKRIFNDLLLEKEKRVTLDSLWNQNQTYLVAKTAKDSSYLALNNIHWSTVQGAHNMPMDLELPYTQNYLSFNFNGGQFSNPDKVVYRYILEGIDKNWSPITNKTVSENYRDLPAGNYNFKVTSKGFNEVWSKPTELQFSILPPWYKTWWAYTIFVALFLGLGLVILHYRSQYLKNENRILEEKVNNRTAELKKTIDELENTQSQLIHSEKMASLGELTAGIAHEIQNPMNFINNFSEVSIELIDEMCEELDKGDVEEVKTISKDIAQNLDKINHHGKRASSIVKGMLEHSRNTSGQKELTDINVLADEYLRLSYHGLRAKNKSFNADFKTDLDESLPKVEVVPQDLGRVVLNLINNAFYAVTSIPEEERDEKYKPMVTVSTKKMKEQVLITIKDNGPGIPDDIKEKIFQPFFTTKPTGKGTGLGLSLAYDIITQGHGGAIELDTTLGKGTKFSIYIPL